MVKIRIMDVIKCVNLKKNLVWGSVFLYNCSGRGDDCER